MFVEECGGGFLQKRKRQWHDMDITSQILWTLEKCPSKNEKSIGKLQKLHSAIEDMLIQHNHVLHRSNSIIEFSLNLIYSVPDRIIVVKELLI